MASMMDIQEDKSYCPEILRCVKSPDVQEDNEDMQIERAPCGTVTVDSNFGLRKTGAFGNQFAHVYFARFAQLRKEVEMEAKKKWGSSILIGSRLTKIPSDTECIAIGMIFKKMKLKPRALDEYLDNFKAPELPPSGSLVSDDDSLVLEDSEGRIELTGMDTSKWVTGVVVALKGYQNHGADFVVEDVCVPGLPPQKPLSEEKPPGSRFVVLTSGFQIGKASTEILPFQMMIDYVTGFLGGGQEQQFCSKIVRVIVAGNSLVECEVDLDDISTSKRNRKDSPVTTPLRELDLYLTQLVASVPVDLMPGASDPTNYSLPQQPLHRSLLPSAGTYDSLGRVSNPHKLEVDGISFLGSSGQNIDDINRLCLLDDNLEALANTLRWRLLCPSAPDTIACHPETDDDRFVLTDCPHVYFAGNQKKFATKLLEEDGKTVRLINIPSFSESHTVVMLDLDTLKCHPIKFDVPE
eukprot:179467_1